MNALQRIAHIAYKEALELWRHAGIVAFVLAIPVVEVIILGYATSGGVNNLPAAVYDADRTAASRRLVDAIDQSHGFKVTQFAGNMAQAEHLLDAGAISAFFVIPQGFERGLTGQGKTDVAAVIDGSNTAVANYTTIYAEEVVGHFTAQNLGGPNLKPQTQETQGVLVGAEPRVWYNQELRRENFYIPGLVGTMLALVVLAITAVSIVRERERGTLEQVMVSPTRSWELIAGKLAPIVVIAYFELAAMLVITMRLFNVPVKGSLGLYLGLMAVYLLAEMGVGILISTLSSNQAQALPSIFLLVTVYGILAGFMTPVETMPPAAQWAAALIPLRYFITITREIFAKGAGLPALAPQLWPLMGMSAALFTASILMLRRRLV
ncbi:MAG: ABC transporter permease [Dehalococcoidia bacterium]|nr:MAG: ABC transporter permease [Dehalococcoidia bacterium]